MRPNPLRELLRAGKPSIGTHLLISWPTITELVGQAGSWDYVEFVAEYTPWDLYGLENLGRAIAMFPHLSGMIKIEQDLRGHLAMRALGSGIQNLLFADVRTVADVEQCVRSVRAEHPAAGGLHGVGMRRDVGVVLEGGSPAFVQALDDAVICLMIEKKQAVEDLPALLSVKGVDMVQFGPSDYAMSIGRPRESSHPAVVEAEKYTIETAHKMGIPARAEIRDANGAARHLEMGVRHFCVGWDVRVLYDWFTQNGKAMRELLSRELDTEVPAPKAPAAAGAIQGY
jgi:2-keto-3-deoxy-L-rhamnonate aldolase RhmA